MTQTLHVSGMTCGGCVGNVTKALLAIPGVHEANVNLDAESATIVSDKEVPRPVLSHALDDAGYALD